VGGFVAQGEEQDEVPGHGRRRLRALPVVLAIVCGTLLGAGVFVLNYAEGLAYLSNNPEACVKCHIMQPQYDGWEKSPHHDVATCNDCHTPHSLVAKYLSKARNGWNHSKAFTLQNFEEPIRIKESNAEILNENCRECHEETISEISGHYGDDAEMAPCVFCHRSVGHGPTR